MSDLNILAICGSLRAQSRNLTLLKYAQANAPAGIHIEIADLSEVPFYNADISAQPAAVQQLHDISKQTLQAELDVSNSATGSESLADPIAEHLYVSYEGSLYDGRLKNWLNSSPKLNQLVSAPVLVRV